MHTVVGAERKRPLVVTLLVVVDVLGGLVRLFLGLAFSALVADETTRPVGIVLGGLFLVAAVLQLAAAVGLWKLRPWGRVLQIVVAILSLLNFPLGTIVGALTLVYLFQPAVRTLFSGRPPEAMSAEEREHLLQVASLGNVAAIVAACVVGVGGILWLGIVSAIAIPNLLNAIDRGKQKRTMADLRSIGTAIEAYGQENDVYPEAGDVAALERVLVPKYLANLPRQDGWRHPIAATCESERYRLESFGKDGADEPDHDGPRERFEDDIVFENGEFTQWPEGPPPR